MHAHHVEWRTAGGRTRADNLVTLCSRCHGLVHGGWLDVEVAQGATGRPGFLFRDSQGHVVRRRVLVGPRLAMGGAVRQEAPEVFDQRWLAAIAD